MCLVWQICLICTTLAVPKREGDVFGGSRVLFCSDQTNTGCHIHMFKSSHSYTPTHQEALYMGRVSVMLISLTFQGVGREYMQSPPDITVFAWLMVLQTNWLISPLAGVCCYLQHMTSLVQNIIVLKLLTISGSIHYNDMKVNVWSRQNDIKPMPINH